MVEGAQIDLLSDIVTSEYFSTKDPGEGKVRCCGAHRVNCSCCCADAMLCIRCCRSHCKPGLLSIAALSASKQLTDSGRKGWGSSTASAKACSQIKAAVMCRREAAWSSVITSVRYPCCCSVLAKGAASANPLHSH